jgi:hypothetical protein
VTELSSSVRLTHQFIQKCGQNQDVLFLRKFDDAILQCIQELVVPRLAAASSDEEFLVAWVIGHEKFKIVRSVFKTYIFQRLVRRVIPGRIQKNAACFCYM